MAPTTTTRDPRRDVRAETATPELPDRLPDRRVVPQDPQQAGAQAAYERQLGTRPAHEREFPLTDRENRILAGTPPAFRDGLRKQYETAVLQAVRQEAMRTGNPQDQALFRALSTPNSTLNASQVERLEAILDRDRPGGRPSVRQEWLDRMNTRLEQAGSNLRVGSGIGSDFTMERCPPGMLPREIEPHERRFLQQASQEYAREMSGYHRQRLEERRDVIRQFNRELGLPADAGLNPAVRVPPLNRAQVIQYNRLLQERLTATGFDLQGEKAALTEFKAGLAERFNERIERHNATAAPDQQITIRLEAGWNLSSSLRVAPSGNSPRTAVLRSTGERGVPYPVTDNEPEAPSPAPQPGTRVPPQPTPDPEPVRRPAPTPTPEPEPVRRPAPAPAPVSGELTLTESENRLLAGEAPAFRGGLRAQYNAAVINAVRNEAMRTGSPDDQKLLRALVTPNSVPTAAQVRRLEEIVDRPRPGNRPSVREEWIGTINERLERSGSDLRVGSGIGSDLTMARCAPGTLPAPVTTYEREQLRGLTSEYTREMNAYHGRRLAERRHVIEELNAELGLPRRAGLDPNVRVPPMTRQQVIQYNQLLHSRLEATGFDLAGEQRALQEQKSRLAERFNERIEAHNRRYESNSDRQINVRLEAGWNLSNSLRIVPTYTAELRTDPYRPYQTELTGYPRR